MPDNNNLKLNVTNFGPIVKAEIDLRPLTVFVGPQQHRQVLPSNTDLRAAQVF